MSLPTISSGCDSQCPLHVGQWLDEDTAVSKTVSRKSDAGANPACPAILNYGHEVFDKPWKKVYMSRGSCDS